MKKRYQIPAGRAVQRVRRWAEEQSPVVQLVLPMVEILTLAKQPESSPARGSHTDPHVSVRAHPARVADSFVRRVWCGADSL
jgi:hypothetical protein